MADIDDFEIVDELGLSNEQTFEVIDMNDSTPKNTNINTPTTPDVVLPFLIPKPLVDETSEVIEQETLIPIVYSPEPEEPHLPVKPTISITPFAPIQHTVIPPPPPRIFAPVPLLPKAPPLRRYGNAALIPHDLDSSLDIDTVIDRSRKTLQNTLQVSTQQQQQKDIQTVLEQRRKLLNNK